ncbi:MAG: LemA family protein [Acholeplasmataceae bacterium]|nr:LemA family protein [Acholeplasmataceae bacterium]
MILLGIGGYVGIVAAVIVIVIIGFIIKVYNILVDLRNKVRNSWSQIDVQLKRRFDMIPNLVETVKGYAKHEQSIFGAFAEARQLYQRASDNHDVGLSAQAEKTLGGALSRLMVVQEQYPELKANSNFQELMSQLSDTEDKISFTRQFYNDTAMKLNNKVEMFPSNIVAGMFNFEKVEYFEITISAQKEAPKVSF